MKDWLTIIMFALGTVVGVALLMLAIFAPFILIIWLILHFLV